MKTKNNAKVLEKIRIEKPGQHASIMDRERQIRDDRQIINE